MFSISRIHFDDSVKKKINETIVNMKKRLIRPSRHRHEGAHKIKS